MKKTILTVAILSAFLLSCNNNTKKDENVETVSNETVHEHHTDEGDASLNNDWVKEISLDNGEKWDANKETNEGVEKMKSQIETSKTETLEDYQALSADLNETKNFVVKECTMKGPSHDNLHIFLHPLIEKIEALGRVSTLEEGARIKESIKGNLEGYDSYFK